MKREKFVKLDCIPSRLPYNICPQPIDAGTMNAVSKGFLKYGLIYAGMSSI